jgi:SulP family sulfate permease
MTFRNLKRISSFIPIIEWSASYSRSKALSDITAAVIVTLMLVPQALAYAMLSGLPPHIGLYASMLPLIAYGLLGTSGALAVGPVAVAALMTASAIAPFSDIDPNLGIAAAVILAAISGLILLVSGILKLGFLANFLSHPVIAGFISAASVVIAASQIPTLLGFSASGDNLIDILKSISSKSDQLHQPTIVLSLFVLLILVLSRRYLNKSLLILGIPKFWAQTLSRCVPVFIVLIATLSVHMGFSIFNGVKVVGDIPAGLPSINLPNMDLALWKALWLPAMLITIIGYVESISVAQSLGIKRRERINPDQEMIALGAANIFSGLSSGLPVTGGVSRSVVNADAGAVTPAAGLFTAIGIIASTLFIATWLSALPKFILSATIIVAVLSLFEADVFIKTWKFSKRDFIALVITFALTLLVNVESGISAGVVLSLGLHLYRSSRPHTAIVGQISGTEHFRNVDRHKVNVCENVVTLRIDESLYFANARFLEQRILDILVDHKKLKHLILMCSAVNDIDISAIEILEVINQQLKESEIGLHLSEVKGPVMDQLKRCHFIEELNGKVYLTQYQAYESLSCFNN